MTHASIVITISGGFPDSRRSGSCVERWEFILDGFDLTARGADGIWSYRIEGHDSPPPNPSRFKLCVEAIDAAKP